jgi:hypothetical protein
MLKTVKCPAVVNDYSKGWNDAVDAIMENAPTVEAEPVRHGKWMFTPSDAFEAMFTKPKCSECGFESADGGNYCPACGARMDEG